MMGEVVRGTFIREAAISTDVPLPVMSGSAMTFIPDLVVESLIVQGVAADFLREYRVRFCGPGATEGVRESRFFELPVWSGCPLSEIPDGLRGLLIGPAGLMAAAAGLEFPDLQEEQ